MPRFSIIYDTYCGWCYGAAPVLEALVAAAPDTLLLHRNLFHGSHAPVMSEGFGAQAAVVDARIAALTGQPFGEAYHRNILQSPDAVLNSDLAAQAAWLIHDRGAQAELDLAARLQRGYYVEGWHPQDLGFVRDTLAALGVDTDDLESPDLAAASRARAQEAANLMAQIGAQGVPTILRHGEVTEIITLSAFYRSPAGIARLAA